MTHKKRLWELRRCKSTLQHVLTNALAFAGVLLFCANAGANPPPDPISIDAASASLIACVGKTPADIYGVGGPPGGCDVAGPGPILEIPEAIYGLALGDDQDGHSAGEVSPNLAQPIYFSGDTLSLGVPGTDYDHQQMRGQAAGDRYVTNGSTTLSPRAVMAAGGGNAAAIVAPLFFGVSPLTGLVGGLHVLSVNQTFYNEIPTVPPMMFNLLPVIDDMDALELETFDPNLNNVHDRPIFFTLDPISPSLLGSAADVFVSPPAPAGPGFGLYAGFAALGLVALDQVDAIAVWDDGNLIAAAMPLVDFAIFSLAPGSPSLAPGSPIVDCIPAPGCSAADIFVTDFQGASVLFLSAQAIGMQAADNVDALDVEVGDPQVHGDAGFPVPAISPLGIGLLIGVLFGALVWRQRRKTAHA